MDEKKEKDIGTPKEVDEEALDEAAGGSATGGAGAGKVIMQDIHFAKQVDKSTPDLG